jgi:hypothetical protein
LDLVRKMEVVCVSESFTAAGTPCPRELGHLGCEGHTRESNLAIVLALGRKGRKYSSGRFIRGPALQLLGMQYRQDGVLVLFIKYIWFSII